MLEMNRETKIVYDYMIGYEQESDHFIEDLIDNEYSYDSVVDEYESHARDLVFGMWRKMEIESPFLIVLLTENVFEKIDFKSLAVNCVDTYIENSNCDV